MAAKRKTNGINHGSQSPAATRLATSLLAMRDDVPGYSLLDSGVARLLGGKFAIDPKYIEATIAAVVANPKLQAATSFDAEGARTAIRTDAAYATPEAVARELAEGIRGMRMSQYAVAIDLCDHVLAMTKALMKQPAAKLTAAQHKELDGYRAAADAMSKARKVRRKTTTTPTKRATPKKAAQKAKQASADAQRANVRALRAAARAKSVAARVVGAPPSDASIARPSAAA